MALRKLAHSFMHAGKGLGHVFRSEQNFRIQLLVSFFVFLLSIMLPLQTWQRIVVALLILLVLLVEILNTIFEYLSDLLKPRFNHYVGIVKDVMAGAVLLTSVAAVIIGLMIFYPYLKDMVK